MEIDVVQTGTGLETLNRLLNPTIQLLNDGAAKLGIQIDIWLLLNWVFVVQYWSLLYDVGQVHPTLYERAGPLPATYDPMRYSDMNNIFVNDTLFGIYRDYFESTILPILEVPNGSDYIFQGLDNSTNRLEPVDVAYFQIYSCTQMQLKKTLSLIISVIVADYTFLNPAFMLIILFGAWYHGRKSPKDGTFNWHRPLTVANWCEGCIAKDTENRIGEAEESRFLSQKDWNYFSPVSDEKFFTYFYI